MQERRQKMPPSDENLYAVLRVERSCSFQALRKAYYRRAKECHPDLHHGDPAMEEEFKRLLRAFDVLSDPPRRRAYDEQLALDITPDSVTFAPLEGSSVMDSIADDILEEMIVGNRVPRDATLQTLMRDLRRTELFVTFREARNLYFARDYRAAARILGGLTSDSPLNILYHYHLAACTEMLGKRGAARRHYQTCLDIGASRTPPQRLLRVRRRLHELNRNKGPIGRLFDWLRPDAPDTALPTEQKLQIELNRAMGALLRDEHAESRRLRSSPRMLGD